jgi:hypothetical protein
VNQSPLRAELRRQWREHCKATKTDIPFRQWTAQSEAAETEGGDDD